MELNGKEISELEKEIPRTIYAENDQYYVGQNTAITDKPRKREPDNRIPVAFANRLIKNLTGYAARKGDITTKWTPINSAVTDDSFIKAYGKIESDSQINILNSQLYKTVLKQGKAFDVVWTETDVNGDMIIKVADVPIYQAMPIWDDELSAIKTLSKFIRYYTVPSKKDIKIGNQVLTLEAGHYAEVYYVGYYDVWYLRALDDNGQGDTERRLYTQAQPFTDIQVSSYFGNDEMIPYWWPVKNLIDQFDKVMSGNMNEVDRFNDTWLMFMQNVPPEAKRKIQEMGIIDNLQNALNEFVTDAWPRFLERNIPVAHTQLMLTTLENLIYTIIGVPSFLDETFGTASGVSLLFRLIGLEYAAVETDTYFDIGIDHRNGLIKQGLSKITNYQGVPYTQASLQNYQSSVQHKRNIPLDKTTIINDALALKGVGVSMDTVINYLPKEIIPNVAEELERIKNDMPEPMEPMNLDDV
jgi:SPP1 family phage portal protein